mgnify:CR=1 FL=1
MRKEGGYNGIEFDQLRHFEQVLKFLKKRGIRYTNFTASRYAAKLRDHVRKQEPEKIADIMIIGAFIEARSCERFAKIAPFLEVELSDFYLSLLKSEARHYQDYLTLAKKYAKKDIDERIQYFRELENKLISEPDTEFRFHSGPVSH